MKSEWKLYNNTFADILQKTVYFVENETVFEKLIERNYCSLSYSGSEVLCNAFNDYKKYRIFFANNKRIDCILE